MKSMPSGYFSIWKGSRPQLKCRFYSRKYDFARASVGNGAPGENRLSRLRECPGDECISAVGAPARMNKEDHILAALEL